MKNCQTTSTVNQSNPATSAATLRETPSSESSPSETQTETPATISRAGLSDEEIRKILLGAKVATLTPEYICGSDELEANCDYVKSAGVALTNSTLCITCPHSAKISMSTKIDKVRTGKVAFFLESENDMGLIFVIERCYIYELLQALDSGGALFDLFEHKEEISPQLCEQLYKLAQVNLEKSRIIFGRFQWDDQMFPSRLETLFRPCSSKTANGVLVVSSDPIYDEVLNSVLKKRTGAIHLTTTLGYSEDGRRSDGYITTFLFSYSSENDQIIRHQNIEKR